jgi:uncharacterized protein (TIGR00251 family)
MSIAETKDGVLLTVFVKPNSPKFKIELDGDEIVVYSTEEPVKGKVNKEILKETSKLLGFKAAMVSGATSRQKVLLLSGADKASVEMALKSRLAITRKIDKCNP